MKFRNDISFLRAFSVIAVLFYHFKFSFFKGGFVGVDIFFVISGYLMTRIILSGFEKDNFVFWQYLQKRITRIIPALLAMITFIGFVVYFLIPTQFLSYLNSYFSSSLFFSNIYYYLNSNYFDSGSQFNFLLHTWSLSVEWQFYLIYPFILILFKRLYTNRLNIFKSVYIVMISASLISMLIHSKYDSSFSFYNFYTRAWEMMFGGLAFIFSDKLKAISIKSKNILVAFSLICLCCSIYLMNSHSMKWPSVLTLIPVVSTAVILFLNVDWAIFRNKLVMYLGNISYSLYLWHWPLYVFSLFFGFNDRIRYKILFIIFSFVFASISYYFIEKRDYHKKSKYVLICSIILFCVSFSLTQTDVKFLFNKDVSTLIYNGAKYKYSSAANKQFSLGNKHLADYQAFQNYNLNLLKLSETKSNVILLGDSHAGMFSETLNDIFDSKKFNLIQVTADAAFPIINSDTPYSGSRDFFNFFYKKYFPNKYKSIDLVIISSNYYGYYKEDLIKKINFTESYFKKYNVPVVYLGQTENYPVDYPTHFYLKTKYNVQNSSTDKLFNKVNSANILLQQKIGKRYIDLLDERINKINQDGTPYIYDQNHLTYYGTEQYKPIIKKAMKLIMAES